MSGVDDDWIDPTPVAVFFCHLRGHCPGRWRPSWPGCECRSCRCCGAYQLREMIL